MLAERLLGRPGLALSIIIPALAAAAGAAALVLPRDGRGSERDGGAAIPLTLVDRLAGSDRPAAPSRVSMPGIGASGPVDPVGLRGGALVIPPPGRAGWWSGGPRPGERGRAVIVSHVDSKRGPALFFRLRELVRGARVLVTDRRGRLHRFAVIRTTEVPKSLFSPPAVFGPSSSRELVLITCGGPFDGRHYRDNVILYARAA